MPDHHPEDERLLAHATGASSEAEALLIATHLALCPACRAEVRRLEAAAAAIVDDLAPVAVGAGLLERTLARLDEPEPPPVARPRLDAETERVVPRPLRDYLGGSLGSLRWHGVPGGPREIDLPTSDGHTARLLRIRGGAAMPAHTHAGSELTLVLAGAFSDEYGHYRRGDVSTAGPELTHRPVADPGEACLCLAVQDGPVRLTGTLGRLINPFIR